MSIYGNYHIIKACNRRMGIKALTQSFGAIESFCKCSTPSASPCVPFPSVHRQTQHPNFLYKSTSTKSDSLPILSDSSPNHCNSPESQPWQPIHVKSIPISLPCKHHTTFNHTLNKCQHQVSCWWPLSFLRGIHFCIPSLPIAMQLIHPEKLLQY